MNYCKRERHLWMSSEVKLYSLFTGLACQHVGTPIECMGCNKLIRSGNIAIQAHRIGDEVIIFLNKIINSLTT